MEAIHIRRCRLRVCRRGGWSWGADPGRLLRNATKKLPELIVAQLGALLAESSSSRSIQTLRIRVPATVDELLEIGQEMVAGNAAAMTSSALSRRIHEQAAIALRQSAVTSPESQAVSPEPAAPPAISLADPEVQVLLRRWYDEGILYAIVRALSPAAARRWLWTLRQELPAESSPQIPLPEELTLTAVRLIARHFENLTYPIADLSVQLALSAIALGEHRGPLSVATLDEFVARTLQRLSQDKVIDVSTDYAIAAMPLAVAEKKQRKKSQRPVESAAQIHVKSILPFVVTGILSRLGYIDALRVVLEDADLSDHADCFAAALTYKVCDRPARGWHRDEATRTLAAAMAGTAEAPSNRRMTRFTGVLSEVVSPLDALLVATRQLAANRQPILLDRIAGSGVWVAMDMAGSYPLGWFSDSARLQQTLSLFVDRTLLINARAAFPALLDDLHAHGHRIITNAAPLRDDHWLGTGHGCWTNDAGPGRGGARHIASSLGDAVEILEVINKEFVQQRPLLVPGPTRKLSAAEYAISLATTSALGLWADTLWREREATNPLLALHRFSDLDAAVSFSDTQIVVRPSLGRRYMDLYEHGLLAGVDALPWLYGRSLEFAGL